MAGSFRPVERIVVPVQGTDREFLAQTWAVELAAALGLPVLAVHVAPQETPPDETMFAFLREDCAKWGVELEERILEATDVVGELVEELGPRDLVVIGTWSAPTHFHLGSVALELVRRAPCPVQIVRIK